MNRRTGSIEALLKNKEAFDALLTRQGIPEDEKKYYMEVDTANLSARSRKQMRVSLNSACPCMSGKKFKSCCYIPGQDIPVDDRLTDNPAAKQRKQPWTPK